MHMRPTIAGARCLGVSGAFRCVRALSGTCLCVGSLPVVLRPWSIFSCPAVQAGCSSEAEELAAEVAAKQGELASAQAQQAACQEAADALARDITETERRLQVCIV